MEKNVDNS